MLPLPAKEQLKFAEMIQRNGLSVRRVEELARDRTARHAAPETEESQHDDIPVLKFGRTAHIDSLEQQLRGLLGTKVQIKLKKKESGQIPFVEKLDFFLFYSCITAAPLFKIIKILYFFLRFAVLDLQV